MDALVLAQQLIACRSVTPVDGGAQQIIAEYLTALGFKTQFYNINEVTNLWATWGDKPHLCFAGHTDVVPPGPLNAWRFDPFTPTVMDGKLYGRGAADMKSAIAAMMVAVARFIQKTPQPKIGLAFLITSDEEGLAQDGTQSVLRLLEQQQNLPQWCLVGEASSQDKLGDTIKIGRRGSLTGTLTIHGVQGHVAYPDLALNPIHLFASALNEITQIEWDQGFDSFPKTSLQFSNIQAGTGADNVIPGTLEAKFNLRFSPALTHVQIQARIEAVLNQHQLKYDLQWRLSGKPFLTSESCPFVQHVTSAIERTLGVKPICSTSGGTSDGRFFAEYGIDVVELGPINATIHQVNECVGVEELERLVEVYERVLRNVDQGTL